MTAVLVTDRPAEGCLVVGLLVTGRLEALEVDSPATPLRPGRIDLAVLEQTLPDGGAVLRLAGGARGWLAPARQTLPAAGRPLLVQLAAESAEADKLPRLIRDVTLPGRLLLHRPYARGLDLSRRLQGGAAEAQHRARLGAVVADRPGAWILRAAAADAPDPALAAERDALIAEAEALKVARAAHGPLPRLLRDGLDARERARTEFPLWTAEDDGSLWGDDLATQLLALARPQVALPGGGRLTLEPTAALVAVDVDAGTAADPAAVNRAALAELARQLRLRNLGGTILVDLLKPGGRPDRAAAAAAPALLAGAEAEVHGLTRLGLLELTRPRRGAPFALHWPHLGL